MKKLIRFDWAIKKLLRSKANFVILEGFLSVLLNEQMKILEILESESNREDFQDKQNKVDLLVKNQKQELIIIEVQTTYEYDYMLRMLYGTSKVVTEHLKAGDEYGKIKKVISINIVYFDLGQGKDYVYEGKTQFIGLHEKDELQLTDKLKETFKKEKIYELYPEYYILKINNFNDLAKDNLDEWIYMLKNSEIKTSFKAPGLKEAAKQLDIMKQTETERRSYEIYLENLRYNASMATSAKIEAEEMIYKEGIEVGLEKGKEEGLKKGKEEGLKQGIEEGEKNTKYQIAKKMKAQGFDLETIFNLTGLSEEK